MLREIVLSLFVDVWDRHFVLAMRTKNLVVLYVLLVHGEDLAAIKAYEFEQDVHVVHVGRTPWWISRVDTG